MDESKIVLKIGVLGDSGVGKTCLWMRYTDDTFNYHMVSTIGVDFKTKIIKLEGKDVKLHIWDTCGQEKFRTLTRNFYKQIDGVLLIYDISNRQTFDNIREWYRDLGISNKPIAVVLVANKIDLEKKEVTSEEGQKLAQELGIEFFETSAKESINVTEAFLKISKKAFEIYNSRENKNDQPKQNHQLDVIKKSAFLPCC